MSIVSWNDSFSVNIEIFDNHHKLLISMLNILHDILNSAHIDFEIVDVIFDELVEYVKYHFSEEEKAMMKYKFPGLKIHRREHLNFVNFVITSKVTLTQTGYLLSAIELLNFLKEWLIQHILGTDMKYSKFLNEHGVY